MRTSFTNQASAIPSGPRGVICLHAGWANRPFDVAPQRTFKYDGQLFRVGLARDAAWETKIAAEVSRLGNTLQKAVAADRTTEGSPVYGNLPKLVPPDASRNRHCALQALPGASRRVESAGDDRGKGRSCRRYSYPRWRCAVALLSAQVAAPMRRGVARARSICAGGKDLPGIVPGCGWG